MQPVVKTSKAQYETAHRACCAAGFLCSLFTFLQRRCLSLIFNQLSIYKVRSKISLASVWSQTWTPCLKILCKFLGKPSGTLVKVGGISGEKFFQSWMVNFAKFCAPNISNELLRQLLSIWRTVEEETRHTRVSGVLLKRRMLYRDASGTKRGYTPLCAHNEKSMTLPSGSVVVRN